MQLTELRILSHDLPGTEKFYREIMGLELVSATKDSCSFFAGSSRLTFMDSALEDPVYHFAFTIPNNKLEAALLWAKERLDPLWVSPKNQIADFANWDAKAFYFLDNNGNILEFIARYTIENAINENFQGSALYSISEIGIVVDDVKKFCSDARDRYDLDLFSKQAPNDHFTVLGDDRGLLIVVNKGRNWFPTSIPAKAFPTQILFKDNSGKQQHILLPVI